jgi:hypothetical protein
MAGDLEVYPLARFGPEFEARGEVDVWIPALSLGIEAKTYEDALAPFTRGRLSGLVKNLDDQLDRYLAVGVKRLALITNLSEGSASKLQAALQGHWAKKEKRFKEIVVVSGNPDHLLRYLNGIAKESGKFLERQFQARMLGSQPVTVLATRAGAPSGGSSGPKNATQVEAPSRGGDSRKAARRTRQSVRPVRKSSLNGSA